MPRENYDHSSDPNFVEYYARESQSPETTERFRRIRDRAIGLLAESGRAGLLDVVDIGCGAGAQALLWAHLGHRVSALDVNEQLVNIARARAAQKGLSIRFDIGTATALPYADASADAVLLPELLEHVSDWQSCLNEAVRVLKFGGLLYLSTTNWLCPRQQEFTLPLYSWYPGTLKRWCERKATTTHPEWVNHARYPAVNWFSYFELSRWLRARGFVTMDRFDMLATQTFGGLARAFVTSIRMLPPLRLLGHMATGGTTVWAVRRA
jgi:ubiquinone/menaquinone biosynthesis C-methylase UbiE